MSNSCLQVLGGYGFVDEHPVAKYVRDARVLTPYEGTSQAQKQPSSILRCMRVQSLHVFPVKSTKGSALGDAVVERCGLRHDRRWMVTTADGRKLPVARHRRLMAITAVPDTDGDLVLSAAHLDPLRVPRPVGGRLESVAISGLSDARRAGEAADAWLTEVLGVPVRLFWLDDPSRRPVAPVHGGVPGDPLNLADTAPVLVTTTASLSALNAWIADSGEPGPMVMDRFRPNIVVEGDLEPFAEDGWERIRIGEVEYRFAEHCDRCATTTIDPATLVSGKEPIRTLARHRKWDGHVWFGVRLVPLGEGSIRVGDRVNVLAP